MGSKSPIQNRHRVPRHWRKAWAGPDFMQLAVDELGVWYICKKVLLIHEATLYRWLRGETDIPMSAAVALWYEMSSATQVLDLEARNEAAALHNRVTGLEIGLHEQIAIRSRLHKIADFGCANDPFDMAHRPPPAPTATQPDLLAPLESAILATRR